jgi:predicted DNA-binding protein
MLKQSDMSRMTIDLPVEDHQKLKAVAAVLGKSMREVVLEAVEQVFIAII